MEKVEADLSRSKSLREKQSKEFSWQLEELKQRYEQQVSRFAPSGGREQGHPFMHLFPFSLCIAVLCIKTKFIGMQSLHNGGLRGRVYIENIFVSSSQSFVPLTLSNCFPGLQVATPIFITARWNYLMRYLFFFSSRNSILSFYRF